MGMILAKAEKLVRYDFANGWMISICYLYGIKS